MEDYSVALPAVCAAFIGFSCLEGWLKNREKLKQTRVQIQREEVEFLEGLELNLSCLAIGAPALTNEGYDLKAKERIRSDLALRNECVRSGERRLRSVQESRGRAVSPVVEEALGQYRKLYSELLGPYQRN